MKDLISSAVSSFTDFLSETNKKTKGFYSVNNLVSFAFPLNDFQIQNNLNTIIKHYERSFYYEKPHDQFLILGLDEALTIAENGEGRFAITDKKIREWKNSFINNWNTLSQHNIPLFLGGMKFLIEHSDEDWQDYNDSTWFVPEIMILIEKDKKYLLFNFQSQNYSREQVIKRLQTKLEKLFTIKDRKESSNDLKVVKSEGDAPKDKKKWKQLVMDGLNKISENQIDKIVFSRKVELQLSAEPDLTVIFNKLRSDYPDCYLFIYHHGKSTFFGATPEKLVEFKNGKIEIDALAGSAPRGSNPDEDAKLEKYLLNDGKNLNEHNIVIDHIKKSIIKHAQDLTIEKHYSIKKLANIQHIWSKISAKLLPSSSMLNLLKELFPTPAVCGFPKEAALQIIKKMEGYKRGLYAGIIGWFNFNDEGEFVVAIRSALTTNNKLIAYAGSGIVENSDPETEFKETELKLKTIMSLFINENKN